jgi:hypothetical protein
MADDGKRGADRGGVVAPPPHWMVNKEAIRDRARELARLAGDSDADQSLKQAEAEYQAAAGWRRRRTVLT